MITIHVPGTPVPQGSMSHLGRGRVKYRDDLKPWRNKVRGAYLQQQFGRRLTGPVVLDVEFVLPRPKDHYGTGGNAGRIKDSYLKAQPTSAPDVDKCIRAIGDALTLDKGDLAGLPRPFDNDAQIVTAKGHKRYVDQHETPHAHIAISLAYG